jgi:hypothetical protein
MSANESGRVEGERHVWRVEPSGSDYPALFLSSDRASANAQARYLQLQRLYLLFLVLAGVVGSLRFGQETAHRWLSASSVVFLALGVILLWVMRSQRFDKTWFDCRAVAESVKTATWRYLMRVPPYGPGMELAEADREFVYEIGEILRSRPGVQKEMTAAAESDRPQITDRMREVRSSSLEARRTLYLRERLLNQKEWYRKKAALSARLAFRWFWTVALLQTVALPVAIVNLASDGALFNVGPIAASLAGPLLAWAQIKRFDEIAQTYGLAAQELSALESLAPHATTEPFFEQLVLQSEEAISREHTMWCARRETPLARRMGVSGARH